MMSYQGKSIQVRESKAFLLKLLGLQFFFMKWIYLPIIIKDLDIFFISDLLATCRDFRTIWSMDSFL
jgi:hypothetical protein